MYSLRMGVEVDQENSVMADIDKLLAYAKKEKIATPLQILLRTSHQKLTQAVKARRKLEDKRAERKAAQEKKFGKERAAGATTTETGPTFTSGNRQSRELKAKAPKCNMKVYASKAELDTAFAKNTVQLDQPFIVKNAVDGLPELQKDWTSEKLRSKQFKDIGINYYEPKIARVMMQQGGQAKIAGKDEEGGQAMEVFDPQKVSFTEFFAKCFSKNKRPGPDTEHCEQEINALLLNREVMGQYRLTAFNAVGFRQDMDSDLYNRLYTSIKDGSLLKLFGGDQSKMNTFVQIMEKQSSRNIVFGPSGSGSSMRQEGMPFADGLVFGSRRWFIMTPTAYMKLKNKAGDDFQPGSAFGFFEDMYAELKEEFDMSIGVEHGVFECVQQPGDIVYVPSGVVRTSLTTSDSISYKQDVLLNLNQVSQLGNSIVWQPMRQNWNAAMCYSPVERWSKKKSKKKKSGALSKEQRKEMATNIQTKLGGLERIGLDPLQLVSAFEEQIASKNAKLEMLLPTVFTCLSINSLSRTESAQGTASVSTMDGVHSVSNVCAAVGDDCNRKLFEHADQLKATITWLGKEVGTASGAVGGSEKMENKEL